MSNTNSNAVQTLHDRKEDGSTRLRYSIVQNELQKALREMPWWSPTCTVLQNHLSKLAPGSHVIGVPHDTGDMAKLAAVLLDETKQDALLQCKLPTELLCDATNEAFEPGMCHQNAQTAYAVSICDTIVYGFALSDDGLWREHSWGLVGDKILETTVPRIWYIGIRDIASMKYADTTLKPVFHQYQLDQQRQQQQRQQQPQRVTTTATTVMNVVQHVDKASK